AGDGNLAGEAAHGLRTSLGRFGLPLAADCEGAPSHTSIRVSAADSEMTTEGLMTGRAWFELSIERQVSGGVAAKVVVVRPAGGTLQAELHDLSSVVRLLLEQGRLPWFVTVRGATANR